MDTDRYMECYAAAGLSSRVFISLTSTYDISVTQKKTKLSEGERMHAPSCTSAHKKPHAAK